MMLSKKTSRMLLQAYTIVLWTSIFLSTALADETLFECNFEHDFCGLYQDQNDDFDWTRPTGLTRTGSSGPYSDNTLRSREGHYALTVASSLHVPSMIARLVMPQVSPSDETICLEFYHNMYGTDTGELRVYVKPDDDTAMYRVWMKEFNRDNIWYKTEVQFQMRSRFQIIFEGNVENSARNVIAIDDVSLICGPCNSPDVIATDDDIEGGFFPLKSSPHDISGWSSANELVCASYYTSTYETGTRDYSSDINCGHYGSIDYGLTVKFSSPNYPANYPDLAHCEWIAHTKSGLPIHVSFEDFETEPTYDFIHVGEGDNSEDESSRVIEFHSGSTLPNSFTSSKDSIWIKFLTDNVYNMRGFTVNLRESDATGETTTDWTTEEQTTRWPWWTTWWTTTEMETSTADWTTVDQTTRWTTEMETSTADWTTEEQTTRWPWWTTWWITTEMETTTADWTTVDQTTRWTTEMETTTEDWTTVDQTTRWTTEMETTTEDWTTEEQTTRWPWWTTWWTTTEMETTTADWTTEEQTTRWPWWTTWWTTTEMETTTEDWTTVEETTRWTTEMETTTEERLKTTRWPWWTTWWTTTEMETTTEDWTTEEKTTRWPWWTTWRTTTEMDTTTEDWTTVEETTRLTTEMESTTDAYLCGETIYLPFWHCRMVYSPNYPGNYPNNARCVWFVHSASPLGYMYVYWDDFCTESGYDFVSVGNGDIPGQNVVIGQHSGCTLPLSFASSSNTVWMTFTSDYIYNDRGFAVEFCDASSTSMPSTEETTTELATTTEETTTDRWRTTTEWLTSKQDLWDTTTDWVSTTEETTEEPTTEEYPTTTQAAEKGVTVTCAKTSMKIDINRSILGGMDENDLQLVDPECTGYSNVTHVTFETTHSACGTTFTETSHHIIYQNTVSNRFTDEDVIRRLREVEIPFECVYSRKGRADASFVVDSEKLYLTETGQGNFSFNLDFYHDVSYETPYYDYEYPIEVSLGERIYVGAAVETNTTDLELFLDTCKGTPTDDPNHSTQYVFIENGCIKDATVQLHPVDNPSEKHFSIEAFDFVESSTSLVYIHCDMLVCNATDPSSRCQHGCVLRHRRDVREVSSLGSRTLTQGPINLYRGDIAIVHGLSQGKDTIVESTSQWIMIYAAMVVFVMGSAMAVAAVLYARHTRRKLEAHILQYA